MITIADAVVQTGLHILIFGERGVGKTSLANVISPLLTVMDKDLTDQPPQRLVAKVNVNRGDSFATVWNRVFEEVSFTENQPVVGINAEPISRRITLKAAFNLTDDPTIQPLMK
jgi:ABC-type branched-subunit amino acid transport system ATPase component